MRKVNGAAGPRSAVRRSSVFLVIVLAAGLLSVPSQVLGVGLVLSGQQGLADLDARTGSVAPTASQVATAAALGANVTWNRFGTPHSLIKYGGYLATALSGDTAGSAARSWLDGQKALFRLTSVANSSLELISDNQLPGSNGHAVLFRQRFGTLPAVQDGMITLGVVGTSAAGWSVAYVSSTSAGTQAAPAAATVSATAAWLAAAQNAGQPGAASAISKVHTENGWTAFAVSGYAQLQRARLRALAIPGAGVRPVYEVDVLNAMGAQSIAYVSLVDAVSKKVWFRQNRVDDAAADSARPDYRAGETSDAPVTGTFSGTTGPAGSCGPQHLISAPAGTQSIDVIASSTIPANDIVLKLIYKVTNATVGSSDEATSPEAIHYAPAGGVPAGNYAAQVCPFTAGAAPFDYSGQFITQDTASGGVPYPPEWKLFTAYPSLSYSNTDSRIIACWEKTTAAADCSLPVKNLASRSPWDFIVGANSPSFTSIGNNAKTAEAWLSPLTPGENYSPPAADRRYYFPWTNQWYTSKCNPTNFASPTRNDIDASIINLFVGHNRFHDFSYFLGFTEQAWNLQQDNFGNGQPGPFPGNEADPELGNVQAGAVTGGAPSYEGRDNANQITLQDGIAPITNQYLFQPIAAAFYSPCIDGSFDTTVFGHEYTHAISNRMVGGPDSSLTGDQAGAMGESWSDLDALEYLHEFSYVPTSGENPWALGAYATGNKQVGIRNYALDSNPLNYSDIGYDSACNAPLVGPPVEPACAARSEVHSDGEIWNAVNYDLRAALVSKYNGSFPESNTTLQRNCANGVLPADKCPGNRRWIQIMYDAWLLMPPDVSMLDARDAYLAADVMRFGGANQTAMWHVFANRGMGQGASTIDDNDPDPKPSFKSPVQYSPILHFSAVNENGTAVKAKIYVGRYEAAVTPAADTDPATPLSKDLAMAPGIYDFVATAPGYGHLRFSWTVGNTIASAALHFTTNWASSAKGATASGDGGNFADLIDDTENTDWAVVAAAPNVNGKQVTVKLSGAHVVDRVQVSAMLHPRDDADDYDNISQSRFSALRSFDIQTCNENTANCTLPISWTTVGHFVNAFKAGIPRPLMPQMLIRSFDVTNTMATRVRLVVLDNQCTGNPAYAGEQDNDPTNDTDCQLASTQDTNVRVAELQVFSGGSSAHVYNDPVVAQTLSAPATAGAGDAVQFTASFQNLGPSTSSSPVLTLSLPVGVNFDSATGAGQYDPATRTVRWQLSDLAANASGSRVVSVHVGPLVQPGTVLLAEADFTAPSTVANPAFSSTLVT